MKALISPSHAARVDNLIAQLAAEYRQLPKCDALPLVFREALARAGLPGGYARHGAIARPLVESMATDRG